MYTARFIDNRKVKEVCFGDGELFDMANFFESHKIPFKIYTSYGLVDPEKCGYVPLAGWDWWRMEAWLETDWDN
jgi:hypothetical protein